MFPMLIPILAQIPGIIGQFFKQKNEIQTQQLSNQLALEQEKNKLIAQGMITQGELGQAQLAATSSRFKEFIYCVILSPIVITCFDPLKGKEIFTSLNIVPEWYLGMVVTIGLAMWGINSDKVQNFMQARRDYKLELKRIDRKAYYDALRKSKGFVTGDDVKEMEDVFDVLDKENAKNG